MELLVGGAERYFKTYFLRVRSQLAPKHSKSRNRDQMVRYKNKCYKYYADNIWIRKQMFQGAVAKFYGGVWISIFLIRFMKCENKTSSMVAV